VVFNLALTSVETCSFVEKLLVHMCFMVFGSLIQRIKSESIESHFACVRACMCLTVQVIFSKLFVHILFKLTWLLLETINNPKKYDWHWPSFQGYRHQTVMGAPCGFHCNSRILYCNLSPRRFDISAFSFLFLCCAPVKRMNFQKNLTCRISKSKDGKYQLKLLEIRI
jgi:hypothetical protein